MLQKLKNIVCGHNGRWNATFGAYFTFLQEANNTLIRRIGTDPITRLYDGTRAEYTNEHATFLFVSKVTLALNRFILVMTAEALEFAILGERFSPMLDVPMRQIDPEQVRSLTLGTAVGLAFCGTEPSEYHSIRNLLITTQKKISENPLEVQEYSGMYAAGGHTKYFNILSRHILDVLKMDHAEHVASCAGLMTYFSHTAVTVREFTDRLISADEGELRKILATT